MSISDIFSVLANFLTLGCPFGKSDEEEYRNSAKETFKTSDEGRKINELKKALDEVRHHGKTKNAEDQESVDVYGKNCRR